MTVGEFARAHLDKLNPNKISRIRLDECENTIVFRRRLPDMSYFDTPDRSGGSSRLPQ